LALVVSGVWRDSSGSIVFLALFEAEFCVLALDWNRRGWDVDIVCMIFLFPAGSIMHVSQCFCMLVAPFPITGSHLSFADIGGQGTQVGSQEAADPAQGNVVI
jgi:hypothetical protein